jgi:hypothetical protein
MKPSEQIAQLEKEKAALQEQVNGLLRRVNELEQARPKGKSRQQAEEGLKMLQAGPVSLAQFAALNSKYPSDVPYAIRNLLKIDVKTVRTASGSVYMLAVHHQKYVEGLAKEKAAKEASEKEAKEEIPQTQAASTSTGAAVAA